jgi:hypothetical protein
LIEATPGTIGDGAARQERKSIGDGAARQERKSIGDGAARFLEGFLERTLPRTNASSKERTTPGTLPRRYDANDRSETSVGSTIFVFAK